MNTKETELPVAVITGAASGIGCALAKAFLQKVGRVVLADIDSKKLSVCQKELGPAPEDSLQVITTDVTSMESLHALASKTLEIYGRIDYLFNIAGVSGKMAPLWEQSVEDINQVMEVNLRGIVKGIHVFLPFMFNQPHRSHIVNMSSCFGLVSASNMAAYAMSKSAIISLSESLYFELKNHDKPVDVSVVCPSFVKTELLQNSYNQVENTLHGHMVTFLKQARDPMDIAEHIIEHVLKKSFYILPDREIKGYVEGKCSAIINQTRPHTHSLEKIIANLALRDTP